MQVAKPSTIIIIIMLYFYYYSCEVFCNSKSIFKSFVMAKLILFFFFFKNSIIVYVVILFFLCTSVHAYFLQYINKGNGFLFKYLFYFYKVFLINFIVFWVNYFDSKAISHSIKCNLAIFKNIFLFIFLTCVYFHWYYFISPTVYF